MQINGVDSVVPRDDCWKCVYSEFTKQQLFCTPPTARCPWITLSALMEQPFVTNSQGEFTFFFLQPLTWKSWITPIWGVVVNEIFQGNKIYNVKGQGTFQKKYLSSYFNLKQKWKLEHGCGLLLTEVRREDCLVQLWARRGWCALKSRKQRCASGK